MLLWRHDQRQTQALCAVWHVATTPRGGQSTVSHDVLGGCRQHAVPPCCRREHGSVSQSPAPEHKPLPVMSVRCAFEHQKSSHPPPPRGRPANRPASKGQTHQRGQGMLIASEAKQSRGRGSRHCERRAKRSSPGGRGSCHCERSEAIQRAVPTLDCFVASLLAMTEGSFRSPQ
jgi:hypothetical protein